MSAVAKSTPSEAGEAARIKALAQGFSAERADKRAREAMDMAHIGIIATRVDDYIKANPGDFQPGDWERTNNVIMLIQVKAANPKLCLKTFAEFPEFDFLHDFFGLARHAHAPTGKLQNCFLPRCMRG